MSVSIRFLQKHAKPHILRGVNEDVNLLNFLLCVSFFFLFFFLS